MITTVTVIYGTVANYVAPNGSGGGIVAQLVRYRGEVMDQYLWGYKRAKYTYSWRGLYAYCCGNFGTFWWRHRCKYCKVTTW